MAQQFQVGDTVRLLRTGLIAEVTEVGGRYKTMVLCAWLDEDEEFQETYFRIEDLDLVQAKQMQETKV